MKYLRIIGLAVTVAAVVMAVGAATSSATVFCKNNSNTETCSEKYKTGTAVIASSEGSLVFETTGGSIINTCTSMSAEEELGAEGSSTTTIKGTLAASAVKLSGCSSTTHVIEGGEGEVHWTSGTDNGTGTATGGAVTTISGGVSCTYGLGGEMKEWGSLIGGEPPYMSVNKIVKKVAGGFLCAGEARVTGKLVLTSPTVGYVTSG